MNQAADEPNAVQTEQSPDTLAPSAQAKAIARLATMPEHNPNPVIETDLQGQVTYLNPVAQAQFPNLKAAGPQHPLLQGLSNIVRSLERDAQSSLTREIWVGEAKYEQKIAYLPDNGLIRIYANDLTSRMKAEQALEWEAQVSAAMATLSQALLMAESLDNTSSLVLEQAQHLTASPLGFVGYLNPHTSEFVSPESDENLWLACQVQESENGFKQFCELWKWALSYQQPLLVNSPVEAPWPSNLDPKLASITRFLCAPAFVGDKLVGQVALANAPRPYEGPDLTLIKRLADLYAVAVQRARDAQELQKHRTQLEERVDQRTASLQSANQQLQREISERLRAEEELRLRMDQLTALSRASQAMSASLNLDQVLEEIISLVRIVAAADYAGVVLLEKENRLGSSATNLPTMVGQEDRFKDEGLTSWIIHSRQTIFIDEINPDGTIQSDLSEGAPRFANPAVVKAGVKSIAAIPLMAKGRLLAVLYLYSQWPNAFRDPLPLLTIFTHQAAIAVENARLFAQAQQRAEELAVLNQAGQAMTSSLDLEQVLHTSLRQATQVLQTEAGSILLLDEEKDELEFVAAIGASADALKGRRLPSNEGVAGWVVQNAEPSIVFDVQNDPHFYPVMDASIDFVTRSILAVPLQSKGRVIGVMEALNKVGAPFQPEDMRLLESLAASAAVAIENAQLYEAVQRELAERARAEAALEQERSLLAQRVAERTAELSAVNAELARASRLKDEFLASMSHELRTPLNAILGMSEALQEEVYGPQNPKQLRTLHTIEESGRHLLSLINDILDVSKIEAGQLQLDIQEIPVEPVCQASLRLVKQAAHKKGLKVSATYDSEVAHIQADERRLKQILVNLLSNAVKFTPEGGSIGLEVSGDSEGQAVHFCVWDTGIGISAQDLPQLFQPFVQLDGGLARQHAGTGLGLALVHRLTELHGGGISVDSQPGRGSRFTVSLPWDKGPPGSSGGSGEREPGSQPPDAPDPRRALPAEGPSGGAGQPLVLLAEDNEANINTLSSYLLAKGYRVAVARNGDEALELVKSEGPDLVLMDIQMPGTDGLQATRRIRAGGSNVPIVALTALAMPGDRQRCLDAGANAYLSKPVTLKSLIGVIETLLPSPPKRST